MEITRVIFNDESFISREALAVCSVVLDDCLKLKGICLYKGSEGYYVTFPSKQDVYKKISRLNEGVSIQYPENYREKSKQGEGNKAYEEFYHPVSNKLYEYILNTILDGYEVCRDDIDAHKTKISYRL